MTESKPKIFTANDFKDANLIHKEIMLPGNFKVSCYDPQKAAEIANKVIESKLGPKVYGKELSIEWLTAMPVGATRTAYLFDIQELPKKECEHEPDYYKTWQDKNGVKTSYCRHCSVELTAKWEVKK